MQTYTCLIAKAKILSVNANLKYIKEINTIQDKYDIIKPKLLELGRANESTLEDLKANMGSAWNSLIANVKSDVEKLKE